MTKDQELRDLLATELKALDPIPSGDCVVYGGGSIGREAAARLMESGRTVRAFLDSRLTGAIDGIPIFHPSDEEAKRFATEGSTVVIAVFNFTADPWPIWTLLEGMGYRRIISFNEFQEHFALEPHFWLTKRAHVLENRDRVKAGWDLLADDHSRQVFLDSICLRISFDLRLLREPTWGQQYLTDDLPRPRMPLRFIDGGAFTGDTIESLLERGATFESLAAFEPDSANFRKLRETVRSRRDAFNDVSLWPCGTSDSTRLASFRTGQGAGSAVVDDGDVHVQLVALDEVLPNFSPTYIKLDIEGSELDTMRGGAEMIHRDQPSLAVCVYHRPDHLWEIPLYMRQLLPSHQIALRYHTYQAFELVAYAFPND